MTTKPFFISFLKSFSQSEDWEILRSAKGNDVIYEPWQIVFYLSVAIVAGVLASLLTAKPNKDKVKLFHDLIGTPVQPEEIIKKPCTLPIEWSLHPERNGSKIQISKFVRHQKFPI